jgi:anti-sigma-K factor RskA
VNAECEQMIESGAYVLGILDADDRAAYERHLRTCEICQREVADFSGLPNLLARLDPDDAALLAGPDSDIERDLDRRRDRDLDRTIDRERDLGRQRRPVFEAPPEPPQRHLRPLPSVPRSDDTPARSTRVQRGEQRRQRRWRTVTAGLAAAACLALGVLVGARFLNQGPVPPKQPTIAMRAVADSVPINAQVALDPFSGGTQIRMHCVYSGGQAGPQWTLKMFVYPKDGGAPEQVSTWTAKKGDDVNVAAATRFAPTDIGRVELRKGDSTPLLVYENA